MNRLERLQEEVIDIQIQIRDLEEQRMALKRTLNAKLSALLRDRKLLQKVKSIDSFSHSNFCPYEPKKRENER